MWKTWLTIAIFGLGASFGASITVPNAQTNSTGNIQGGGPPTTTPGVTQMLFDASQFPGPMLINKLSFRAVAGSGPVDIDYGNVNVYLSTSPRSPDAASPDRMSLTFADNQGPDFTLVYAGLNVRLQSPGCPGPAVCPFDLTNVLTTPFYYNPANGNLLLQVISSGFRDVLGTSAVDAMMFDSPGGLIAEVAAFGTTDATTGFFYEPRGLITAFEYDAVPEPASWMLASVPVALLLRRRRR